MYNTLVIKECSSFFLLIDISPSVVCFHHHFISFQSLLHLLVDLSYRHNIDKQSVQTFDNCSIGHCSYQTSSFHLFPYCYHLCNCLIHHLKYYCFLPFGMLNYCHSKNSVHYYYDSSLYLYSQTIFPSFSSLFH